MTIAEAWLRIRLDPQWKKKVALTAAVNLIPYAGPFITMGYVLNYARAVAWDADGGRLPEWSAFGEHAKRGLHAFVVSLVYSLPLLPVILVLEIPIFAVLFAAAPRSGEPSASVLVAMAVYLVVIVAVTYAYVPVSYSGLLEYLMFDRLDAAWRFRDVLARMRANFRPLSAVVLRMIVLGLGVTAVSFGIVGGAAAVMLLPALGRGDLAPFAFALIPVCYMLFFAVIAAASAVMNLIVYAMLAMYARGAYDLPVRAA